MPSLKAVKQRLKTHIPGRNPDHQSVPSFQQPGSPLTHNTRAISSAHIATNHLSSSSSTSVVPARSSEACAASDSGSRGSPSTDLWDRALESLSVERKAAIEYQASQQPSTNIVDHLCTLTEQKRAECEKRGWKIEFNGHQVILRDVTEKICVWLHKFKEIGDVVVNYDPVHLALPWAGIRFLLEVGMRFMPCNDCENDTYIVGRCRKSTKGTPAHWDRESNKLSLSLSGLWDSLSPQFRLGSSSGQSSRCADSALCCNIELPRKCIPAL